MRTVNCDLRNNTATHEQIHIQLSNSNPKVGKELNDLMDDHVRMLEPVCRREGTRAICAARDGRWMWPQPYAWSRRQQSRLMTAHSYTWWLNTKASWSARDTCAYPAVCLRTQQNARRTECTTFWPNRSRWKLWSTLPRNGAAWYRNTTPRLLRMPTDA
jgi:hypothetical protein